VSNAVSHESSPLTCFWWIAPLEIPGALALLRLRWNVPDGSVRAVEEVLVYDTPEGYQIVSMALQRCMTQGIELHVIAPVGPDNFCDCEEV